jgi:hypothetical protein
MSGIGFRVPGKPFRIPGMDFRASGVDFRGAGTGFRAAGSGVLVRDSLGRMMGAARQRPWARHAAVGFAEPARWITVWH